MAYSRVFFLKQHKNNTFPLTVIINPSTLIFMMTNYFTPVFLYHNIHFYFLFMDSLTHLPLPALE